LKPYPIPHLQRKKSGANLWIETRSVACAAGSLKT
jgi:hypothetical protein